MKALKMNNAMVVAKPGTINSMTIAGMCTMISRINNRNPWPRRLFQAVLTGIDHMRFVKKLFRPPKKKKSTMNPNMNPMNDPMTRRNAKIRTHMKAKTMNIMENANPWMKYFGIVLRTDPLSGMVDASEDTVSLLSVTFKDY